MTLESGTVGCIVVASLDPLFRLSVSVGVAIGDLVSCLVSQDVGDALVDVARAWGDILGFLETVADYIINAIIIIIELVLGFFEIIFTSAGVADGKTVEMAFFSIVDAIGSMVSAILGEDAACLIEDVTCLGWLFVFAAGHVFGFRGRAVQWLRRRAVRHPNGPVRPVTSAVFAGIAVFPRVMRHS